jgi:hypothetical protein
MENSGEMKITTLINKYESVLDLFSFTPLPRFQGRKTVSSRGVLGTFLLFVTMIVYISMTSQRFLSMTEPNQRGACAVSRVRHNLSDQ